MADTERKFSELSVAGTLTDNDILALSQTDIGTSTLISVRATLIAIATHIAKVAAFTNDLDTTSKTLIGAINELKQLISLIPQFSIDVVQTLPVSDISETTIYLVPSSDPEQGNYYEEYIYVNNTWELVGTTAVDLSAYYTRLEVDGLLAAKANTSDVTAALALKEAKSDLADDVTDIVVGLTDEQTTTPGNPVTLTTEQSGGAKSAVVTFTPKQSGTGDPSPTNVRPFVLWDGLVLNQAKKNLINIADATYTQTEKLCDLDASYVGKTVCISAMVSDTIGTDPKARIRLQYDLNGVTTYIARDFVSSGISGGTTTIPQGATNISIYGQKTISTISYKLSNVQLEFGSTSTEYEPYQGTTHTATFDSTVYGGSYDFASGKLVIDRVLYALNGTEKFIGTTGNRVYFSNILDIYIPEVPNTVELYCSHFKCASQSTYASGTVYKSTSNVAVVFCDNTLCTDITTFTDYVTAQYNANTPIVIVYKLATPTEITLTPEDIELLKGSNTVWTDGDTVTIGYSKLPNGNLGAVVDYIKKLEARIAALES